MKKRYYLAIIIIILIAIFALSSPSEPAEKTKITPTNESGEYIVKMDDEYVDACIENAEDGQVYYLYQADMMKLYDYNGGDWSKPFMVVYKNDTVNMNLHARVIENVYDMDGNLL